MIRMMRREGLEAPENRRTHKNLDCAVLNYFYDQVEDQGGPRIETARAAYVPTESRKRIWHASWIYRDTHIQLCVRNQENILAVWHASPEGRYGKGNAWA